MRKLTYAAAVAAVLAAGYTQVDLLVMFSRFGMDLGFNPVIVESPGGGYAFPFEVDSLAGRWEQHMPDRYDAPGILFVDGVGHRYTGGDSSLVLTLTPPRTVRFSAKDPRGRLSGDIEIFFDDCDPDSVLALTPTLGRADTLTTYRFRIFTDKGEPVADRLVSNRSRAMSWLNPGRYQLYWAWLDDVGMRGQWIGPVKVVADSCP